MSSRELATDETSHALKSKRGRARSVLSRAEEAELMDRKGWDAAARERLILAHKQIIEQAVDEVLTVNPCYAEREDVLSEAWVVAIQFIDATCYYPNSRLGGRVVATVKTQLRLWLNREQHKDRGRCSQRELEEIEWIEQSGLPAEMKETYEDLIDRCWEPAKGERTRQSAKLWVFRWERVPVLAPSLISSLDQARIAREFCNPVGLHELIHDGGTGRAPSFEDRASLTNRGWEDRLVLQMAIHPALLQLKPRHQAVLRLRYFEDLTLEETGRRLQVSGTAVRCMEQQAIKKLAKIYAEGGRTQWFCGKTRPHPSRWEELGFH